MKLDVRERGWDVEVVSVLPSGYEERMTVREIQEIPGFMDQKTILKIFISPPLRLAVDGRAEHE